MIRSNNLWLEQVPIKTQYKEIHPNRVGKEVREYMLEEEKTEATEEEVEEADEDTAPEEPVADEE